MLLTNQTFRNLFRSENIQSEEGLELQNVTVLFTDLKGSTELYEKVGDLKAFHLVRLHFETLERVVSKYSGAVIKTIGDAIMAIFTNPFDGVRAALEILIEIEDFNQKIGDEISLKIGVHCGPSIAVTLNEQVDYFGQTVNTAARIQGLAKEREVVISQDVYHYQGVEGLLKERTVTHSEERVKGIAEHLEIWNIKA